MRQRTRSVIHLLAVVVAEPIGVDPLPGERDPLGAGQSHLRGRAQP